MGAVQPKCCATQEVQNTAGDAATETKLLGDQPIPPGGKPLWLAEAEEYVALQKQKEAEQARRIQQLAAERAEEERKEKELEDKKKSEEDAKSKDDAKKKKPPAKKPPAKTPTPKLDEEAKKVAPAAPAAPAPETAKAPEISAEQQQKIDATRESGDIKFEFEVKCVSARGLRDADWLEGTSDPYCLCEAVGKVKSKFKTKTVSNKENPVWNQAAKMQLCRGDKLKFSIFDQDTGKADDFLGYVELNFDQIHIGYEGELALKDASDTAAKQEAYIKVRVRNLGACVPK